MAETAGLAFSTIHRVWKAFGPQPHRSDPFKLSSDPLFVEKARDVVPRANRAPGPVHSDELRRDHHPSPADKHSIERLAVEPNRDHDGRQREERDRPEFGEDFRQAISLEQKAAHDPHRVRGGNDFASPLRPDRHAIEREHETRKQNRRQKGKQCKLDRLHLR